MILPPPSPWELESYHLLNYFQCIVYVYDNMYLLFTVTSYGVVSGLLSLHILN